VDAFHHLIGGEKEIFAGARAEYGAIVADA
jgi:hypothetical protein